MTHAMQMFVRNLERDQLLREPNHLRERIEALDRLETYFPDGDASGNADLRRRSCAIRARLEAINDALYQSIRQDIQRGGGRDALFGWLPATRRATFATDPTSGANYDYLDELISGVLELDDPVAVVEPAEEMIFYQPTPARHVFDLIDRAALTERDVLVDLGSGLGHVALLTAICTNAQSIGIELETAYVECARRCAEALRVTHVTFLRQDARVADFCRGTVFYLYTPFIGGVLRAVLDALRRQADRRAIRVCTFGPCTSIVAKEPWLTAIGPLEACRIAIFHSNAA